jgi:hypothetical protein
VNKKVAQNPLRHIHSAVTCKIEKQNKDTI